MKSNTSFPRLDWINRLTTQKCEIPCDWLVNMHTVVISVSVSKQLLPQVVSTRGFYQQGVAVCLWWWQSDVSLEQPAVLWQRTLQRLRWIWDVC